MHQQRTASENIVGKGEIAQNEQFLLFPQCFLLNQIIVLPFVQICDIISLFAVEFGEPKIGLWVKGLTAPWHLPGYQQFNCNHTVFIEVCGNCWPDSV